MFLVEATPREVDNRVKLEDMGLTYLRLEVKPLGDAGDAPPAFHPASAHSPTAYRPAPIGDRRTEPRTDASKDRKIVRVGERWVMTYADDNPGRLLAAPIDAGRLGKPVMLIDEPGWGRFQCSAAAVGDDELAVICPGPDRNVVLVQVRGVRDWGKTPPKVNLRASKRHDGAREMVNEGCAHRDGWATLGLGPDGSVHLASVLHDAVALSTMAGDAGQWRVGRMHKPPTTNARPAFVGTGEELLLLVGGDEGLWGGTWDGKRWLAPRPIVKQRWIGHHYSAVADGDRVDVIYTPGASHLGRKHIGHVRREGGAWKQLPPMDTGNTIRGLSLCDLGDGKLLAAYAVRNARPIQAAKGAEKMKRFTYTLYRRTFDGNAWSAPAKIAWPEVPRYRPENWTDWNEVGGVVYVPETDLGRFPTLPASAAGMGRVPVAWMAPGFACLPKKERVDPDRGGLLVTTEIELRTVD
jgi:hypothetical protein